MHSQHAVVVAVCNYLILDEKKILERFFKTRYSYAMVGREQEIFHVIVLEGSHSNIYSNLPE